MPDARKRLAPRLEINRCFHHFSKDSEHSVESCDLCGAFDDYKKAKPLAPQEERQQFSSVWAQPSTAAPPEQGELTTDADYATAKRVVEAIRETGVPARGVAEMLAATLAVRERECAALKARIRTLTEQFSDLQLAHTSETP